MCMVWRTASGRKSQDQTGKALQLAVHLFVFMPMSSEDDSCALGVDAARDRFVSNHEPPRRSEY